MDRGANPLRIYAALEGGIGVYAIVFPGVLWLVDALHGRVFALLYASSLPLGLARFGLAFLALLPATLLMGGTVPAMGRALVRDEGELGAGAGSFYAWNTLGAALGSGLGGFLLIPALGLRWSTLAAAAINLGVGAVAWRLGGSATPAEQAVVTSHRSSLRRPGVEKQAPTDSRWLLACYGISGFAALAFEVILLTRVLILVYGSSVYAFSVVLTGFLLGLGLGSLLVARRIDRVADLGGAVGILQAIIGLSILVTSPFYSHLLLGPEGVGRFVRGGWPRHTDDWPILEFSGPKALFLETARENLWAMQQEAKGPLPLSNAGSTQRSRRHTRPSGASRRGDCSVPPGGGREVPFCALQPWDRLSPGQARSGRGARGAGAVC